MVITEKLDGRFLSFGKRKNPLVRDNGIFGSPKDGDGRRDFLFKEFRAYHL